MRRLLPFLVVAALVGAAATALAQGGGGNTNPYTVAEPGVTSGQVLKLSNAASGCRGVRTATVRVTPPTGAVLGFVRVAVDNRLAARLTGVPRAASATVRIPLSGARLTVSALTLGGQSLAASRVYADCSRPPEPPAGGGGAGEG